MQTLDLAPFFDAAGEGFAQKAALDGRDVWLIFDADYQDVFLGEVPVAGREYAAWALDTQLGQAAAGSVVIIEHLLYTVREVEVDHTGATLLRLEKT